MSEHLVFFKGSEIRKTLHNDEWWFVIKDVIATLTESKDPVQYLKKLKQRDKELADVINKGGGQFVPPLKLPFETSGGKQKLNCWNTQGIFRLIQSIPSPKAEPFKKWLAKVGYERIQEIEDPELALIRIKNTYKAKGYSSEWIEKRVRGINVRKELTKEWKNRDIKEGVEYSILTSEISKATFGMTPSEYKELKGLGKPSENLRDHMTDLELIFTMLGEASTAEITQARDIYGLDANKKAAKDGGDVAGSARVQLEKKSGKRISSSINYKDLSESEQRKLIDK